MAGYKVFRDGGTMPIGIVTSGTTFADTGLAPSSPHSYTVVAVDAAGKASAPSAVAATTLAGVDTIPPVASGPMQPIVVGSTILKGAIGSSIPVRLSSESSSPARCMASSAWCRLMTMRAARAVGVRRRAGGCLLRPRPGSMCHALGERA